MLLRWDSSTRTCRRSADALASALARSNFSSASSSTTRSRSRLFSFSSLRMRSVSMRASWCSWSRCWSVSSMGIRSPLRLLSRFPRTFLPDLAKSLIRRMSDAPGVLQKGFVVHVLVYGVAVRLIPTTCGRLRYPKTPRKIRARCSAVAFQDFPHDLVVASIHVALTAGALVGASPPHLRFPTSGLAESGGTTSLQQQAPCPGNPRVKEHSPPQVCRPQPHRPGVSTQESSRVHVLPRV